MDTPTANHGGSPRVTLEGTNTPSDYLEEPVILDRRGEIPCQRRGEIPAG